MLQYITCALIIFMLCAVCQYYIMKKAGLQSKTIFLVLVLSLVLIVLFPKFLYYYGWFGILLLYIASVLIVLSVGYRLGEQVAGHAESISESDIKSVPEVSFFRVPNVLSGLLKRGSVHKQVNQTADETALKCPEEQSKEPASQDALDIDEEEREALSSALKNVDALNTEYEESLTDDEITGILCGSSDAGESASFTAMDTDLTGNEFCIESELPDIEVTSLLSDNKDISAIATPVLSETGSDELAPETTALDVPLYIENTSSVEIDIIDVESNEQYGELRTTRGVVEAQTAGFSGELEMAEASIEDLGEPELNTVLGETDENGFNLIQQDDTDLINLTGYYKTIQDSGQELQWLQDFIELGFAALSAGLEDVAVNYFQRVLEITADPELAFMIVREISHIQVNAGRYDEAINILSYTMDRWADNPQSITLENDILWCTYMRDTLMKAGMPGVPLSRVPRLLRIKVDELFRNKLMEG